MLNFNVKLYVVEVDTTAAVTTGNNSNNMPSESQTNSHLMREGIIFKYGNDIVDHEGIKKRIKVNDISSTQPQRHI